MSEHQDTDHELTGDAASAAVTKAFEEARRRLGARDVTEGRPQLKAFKAKQLYGGWKTPTRGCFDVYLKEDVDELLAASQQCGNCVSWTANAGDPETGKCGSAKAHWHGAGFNTFAAWCCRDWSAKDGQ